MVGHISLTPIVLHYKVARIKHREHHAHANDPELDPDYAYHGKNIQLVVVFS